MEKKIIRLLQYRRHELMNQLQIIQGYIQINKLELAIDKIGEIVESYEQERRLFHLDIPKFTWWLFTFSLDKNLFPLKYEILNFSQGIEHLDHTILSKSKEMIEQLCNSVNHKQISEGKVKLIEREENMTIQIELLGDFSLLQKRQFNVKTVSYTIENNKITATHSVALHKKV